MLCPKWVNIPIYAIELMLATGSSLCSVLDYAYQVLKVLSSDSQGCFVSVGNFLIKDLGFVPKHTHQLDQTRII